MLKKTKKQEDVQNFSRDLENNSHHHEENSQHAVQHTECLRLGDLLYECHMCTAAAHVISNLNMACPRSY